MSKQQSETKPTGREQWSSQLGFLLAAVGSAIGLGNIWRFPGVAYNNGGGAFLIPYIVALLTAGIPVLLLEYGIGHKYKGSAPLSFRRMNPKAEIIGWWQVAVCFVIMVYYAVVIGWSCSYIVFSQTLRWGDDPSKFFNESYLHLDTQSLFSLSPVWGVYIAIVLIWIIVLVIISRGVQNGLEKANKIFLPLLVILFLALVIRAVTLPGALEGLNVFFEPKWSVLTDTKVWIAAYAQVFYSLSVGFGIMITYSSYLPKKANLNGSGFVAAFANSSFELLAGIGVFAALGFMSMQENVQIADLKGISGINLSFVTFPKIISLMPSGSIFGILFFTSLVLAGLTSIISVVQVVSGAIQEKFGYDTKKTVFWLGLLSMFISLTIFGTTTGIYALDTVDAFINEIGVVSGAIMTCLFAAVVAKKLPELRRHLNSVSTIKIGSWWNFMAGFFVPAILTLMMGIGLYRLITVGYSDYPSWYVAIFGWAMIALVALTSVWLSKLPWKNDTQQAENNN